MVFLGLSGRGHQRLGHRPSRHRAPGPSCHPPSADWRDPSPSHGPGIRIRDLTPLALTVPGRHNHHLDPESDAQQSRREPRCVAATNGGRMMRFPRDLQFQSRRSPVMGTHGMVASSQPLASQVGLSILMQGGNAADAAVATAAALNVTEPCSTGLGGDCFALYFEGATNRITALNASGRAPRTLSIDRLEREGLARVWHQRHAHTVTVPGACSGWCTLIEHHGSMPIATILAPAIQLAEEGYPVGPIVAHHWKHDERLLQSNASQELLIDGRAPRPGERFRNPTLGRTLRTIAAGGAEAFYHGETATRIAGAVQQFGGTMDVDDLASHEANWETPISTVFRDVRVWECPPNGQGLAALLALNIYQEFPQYPPLSV